MDPVGLLGAVIERRFLPEASRMAWWNFGSHGDYCAWSREIVRGEWL